MMARCTFRSRVYAGHGQDALKPFIGEHVQATGKVFERNGGHAIEITEIHKLPAAAGK